MIYFALPLLVELIKYKNLNTILLIASIFGFVLTSLLFFKQSTNRKATYFLGIFYFIISIHAFQVYLIETKQIYQFSWFFLWPLLIYHLSFIPVYFYFITIIKDEFRWKNSYLLLFIPFILGLIDVIYVYASKDEVYDHILNETITNTVNRFDAHYWLMGLKEHYLMRHIWQFLSLLIVLPELIDFLKKGTKQKLKLILNKWLLLFVVAQLLLSVFTMLHGIDNFSDTSILTDVFGLKNGSAVLIFILYFIVFLIGVIPLYFLSILHGYPRSKNSMHPTVEINELTDNSNNETAGDLKFGLSENTIKSKLDPLIAENVFLEQDFTVSKCSQEMEIPAHHLSYFINETYGQNFSSYKNELRMNHAKHLIFNGFLKNSTMEGLAWECGFANRSSFSKAFKTVMKQSPSEYATNLREKK